MTIDVVVVKSIAYLLAGITYLTGNALIASPVPSRRIKGMGRSMVEDAVIFAVLATVIIFTDIGLTFVGSMLWGGQSSSYMYESYFFPWLNDKIIWLTTLLGGLSVVVGALPALGSLFSAFLLILGTSTLQLYIVRGVAQFLLAYWVPLLYLGVILYGIPARIGRQAGSSIIGFTLGMYVGLPLMRAFGEQFLKELPALSSADIVGKPLEILTGVVLKHVVSLFFVPLFFLAILSLIVAGISQLLGGGQLRFPGVR